MMKSEEDIPAVLMLIQAAGASSAESSLSAEPLLLERQERATVSKCLLFNSKGVPVKARLRKSSLALGMACDEQSCVDSGFEVIDPFYPECICQQEGTAEASREDKGSYTYGSFSRRRELEGKKKIKK